MNSEFLSFFWFVSTQCNFNCEYCIARDYEEEFDFQIQTSNELKIADRLIEISKLVKRVKVDIGGIKEPLFARNLDVVISKLKSVSNIELSLTTNFTLIRNIEDSISHLDKILVSIHIKQRTKSEIDQLINDINRYKKLTWIALTQVDYLLEKEDLENIAKIEFETKIPVELIMYQYSTTEKNDRSPESESIKKYYINSSGKLCSFGYLHFYIFPDGTFFHDLFCRSKTRKKDNFLSELEEIKPFLFPHDLKICPYDYCSCNHNITFQEEYIEACQRLGFSQNYMFNNEYRSELGILKSESGKLKYQSIKEKLYNEQAIPQDTPDSNDRLESFKKKNLELQDTIIRQQEELVRLRKSYSWRIGFGITETAKLFLRWFKIPLTRL
jgi:organic radical activating enzyme